MFDSLNFHRMDPLALVVATTECPYCGARDGASCVTVEGLAGRPTSTHMGRLRAAHRTIDAHYRTMDWTVIDGAVVGARDPQCSFCQGSSGYCSLCPGGNK